MKRTVIIDDRAFESTFDRALQLSNRELIAANPRAARTLLRYHSQTLAELAATLLAQTGVKLATPLLARRALLSAISDINPADNSDSSAPGQVNSGSDDYASLARAVANTLPKVLRAGVDLATLAQFGTPRTQQLARIIQLYLQKLRQAKLVDSDELLWQAAQLASTSNNLSRALFVYGYARLGRDEARFLDTIAGDRTILVLPLLDPPLFADNRATIEFLTEQGWQLETQKTSNTSAGSTKPCQVGAELSHRFLNPTTDAQLQNHQRESTQTESAQTIRAWCYANLDAEVRGVLSAVKALLIAGVDSDQIVISLRNESIYVPTILAVAWEYQLPIKVFYQIPLSQTKLGSWLQLLCRTIEEAFPFETMARYLNHPFSPGLTDAQWREARRRYWHGLKAWQAATKLDLTSLIWPSEDRRADWIARLKALLVADSVKQQAARWPREVIALELFERTLDELIDSVDLADQRLTRERFIHEITELLALLTVPIQPEQTGVELHVPILLLGARYRHVFIIGVAEQILPEPIQDDLLLDFYQRKQLQKHGLQLDSAAQESRREMLTFWSLLHTATDTLTLSYPKLIGTRQTLPSAFFHALALTPIPPKDHHIASIEEARKTFLRRDPSSHPAQLQQDLVLIHARRAWEVESRREDSPDYDEFDGVVGLPLDLANWVFSASQLTALGQCPFKWFARYILKIAEPTETDAELSANLLGSLYHKTLELALGWVKGTDGDLREALLARLEDALLAAEHLAGISTLPTRTAHRNEDLQRLRQAVLGDDFLPIDAEILGLETRFSSSWHGLNVVGDLDRVDSTPDGLVLIDYKTSSSAPLGAKTSDGRARLDVQLPLYIQAAAQALFPGEKVADAYYYSLTKAKVLKRAKVDEAALQELVVRVKAHVENGDYPVAPDINQEACNYCAFDLVCRRGPRLSRKRRLP